VRSRQYHSGPDQSMMRWSWIDSSRKREALTNDLVSRTRHSVPSAVHGQGLDKKSRKQPHAK
jgi:hypothetical protein